MPLALTLYEGQRVFIGDTITVYVTKQSGGQIRIFIEAPTEFKIWRESKDERPEIQRINGKRRIIR